MLSALLVFIAGVFWGVVVELVIRLGEAYFNEGMPLAELLSTTTFYYLLVFGILGIIFLGLAYWLHKKDIEREIKRDDTLAEIKKSIDVLVNEIRQDRNERNNKQS